jgi:hypothetical protein
VLVVLGTALIIPVFIPSRWRSASRRDDEDYGDGAPRVPAQTRLLS